MIHLDTKFSSYLLYKTGYHSFLYLLFPESILFPYNPEENKPIN